MEMTMGRLRLCSMEVSMVKLRLFSLILWTVLLTEPVTAASGRLSEFLALRSGQTIIGSVGADFTTPSPISCSRRCSGDTACTAYVYDRSICSLIYRNTTVNNGLSIKQDTNGQIYIKNMCLNNPCKNGATCLMKDAGYICECAAGFTGSECEACVTGFTGTNCDVDIDFCAGTNPCQNGGICTDGITSYTCDYPLIYRSFNNNTGITRYSQAHISPGKIDKGLFVMGKQNAWADLYDMSEACMVRPTPGQPCLGTLTAWVQIDSWGGGLFTSAGLSTTGIKVECESSYNVYYFMNEVGTFRVQTAPTVSNWFHVAWFVETGSATDRSVIYVNGQQVGNDSIIEPHTVTPDPGPGRVEVGRLIIGEHDSGNNEITLRLDELTLWNRILTPEEITGMADI